MFSVARRRRRKRWTKRCTKEEAIEQHERKKTWKEGLIAIENDWKENVRRQNVEERIFWKGQNVGDWPFFKSVFNFPSWSSKAICWKCGANMMDKLWWDFSLTAAWRKCCYSAVTFFSFLKK